MTHRIVSINDMCQCAKDNCHDDKLSSIKRCVAFAPITLYHRITGAFKKFCENCAAQNIQGDYSPLKPQGIE